MSDPTPEETWQRRLNSLRVAEATESDFAAKFKLQEQIAEAKCKLLEIQNESAQAGSRALRYDISAITKYAPAELIGRESETEILIDAWGKARNDEPKRPHVLVFVALGGEGKTSLVAKWVADLAHQDWPECEAAFAWTFYSQGSRDQAAVSSDLFLAEALRFFGDAEMAGNTQGAFDKGRRLAQLVGQRRALLVLDGLEPLQYPPNSPTPGELKDQGLAALLKGLATSSHGLCVVTSRFTLPDLRVFRGKTMHEERLTRLSRAAGVQLLKSHGVTGSDRRNILIQDGDEQSEKLSEFEKLVEDVDGHALTLHVMGSFLKRAYNGNIQRRDRVTFAKASEKIDNGHAFRAMAAYEQWMADGCEESQRELALLSLSGLFDRPATADCLQALLATPAIAGLTEPLTGLAEEELNCSLNSLQDAMLLTVNRDTNGTLLSVDAHPLIREYFAERMKGAGRTMNEGNLSSFIISNSSFREAHRRLYEHLCNTTKEGDQPTLEDLQPLYQAVSHGCQAGLQQEACNDVYYARIKRRDERYSSMKLGAFGSDLGAIACFFEQPWSHVSPALKEADQAWLLNEAAFTLRALGRLTEALEPMRATMEFNATKQKWKNAAVCASNLSELKLTLGEVAGAVGDASQSVTYADRTGDANWRVVTRTTHADALHQAGGGLGIQPKPAAGSRSHEIFREAEQMQAESLPAYPLLYSLRGFGYCDLLLATAERAAWLRGMGFQPMLTPTPDDTIPDQERENAVEKHGMKSRLGRHGLEACETECLAISQRAMQTLAWLTNHFTNASVLDIALDHLTLGRAALYAAVLSLDSATLASFLLPTSHLQQSVSGLRRAGTLDHLPRGLLTRAWVRTLTSAWTGPESAQSDLDEAWEIAERGPMPLFMADICLYRARLFGCRSAADATSGGDRENIHTSPPPLLGAAPFYPWDSPQADLKESRRLMRNMATVAEWKNSKTPKRPSAGKVHVADMSSFRPRD